MTSVSGKPRWPPQQLESILREVEAIRAEILDLEQRYAMRLAEADDAFRASASNLVDYLALRRRDVRVLQQQLTDLGLSSLGRTESHVLAAVEAVLRVLHNLLGGCWAPPEREPPIDFATGRELLRSHTAALLGPESRQRGVRIMVTMPSEAASDYELVRALVEQGMDVMRVNCAHDNRAAWGNMIRNLRRAEKDVGRPCRVQMDLAGPKLRTGAIDPRSQILKWRPQRDASGFVTEPTRIWLTCAGECESSPSPACGVVLLSPDRLSRLRVGDELRLTDLRGKRRTLKIAECLDGGCWAIGDQTIYLRGDAPLELSHRPAGGEGEATTTTGEIAAGPAEQSFLLLAPGDVVVLTRAQTPGRPATLDGEGRLRPAAIPCATPEVFSDVRAQERIWFDDGKIGGVVEQVSQDELRVRITVASPQGDKLRSDKGINLPDSDLRLPPLGEKDLEDLSFAVHQADLIGMSFVKRPEDVFLLQEHLARHGARDLGVVLKIETRSGFEHLPNILLAAMRSPRVGVMIARGDLAVEVGWERLAEAQEEILWICEAGHVPVIWATQVLENLAKKGVPSRAEITDAAMGERAECVMLNKGPHLVEAVRVLDDILRRMQAHQSKKSARLRALRLSTRASEEGASGR